MERMKLWEKHPSEGVSITKETKADLSSITCGIKRKISKTIASLLMHSDLKEQKNCNLHGSCRTTDLTLWCVLNRTATGITESIFPKQYLLWFICKFFSSILPAVFIAYLCVCKWSVFFFLPAKTLIFWLLPLNI